MSKGLKFLYETVPGRVCLKVLTNPRLSAACGKLLDSKASRCLISPFIKANRIDLNECDAPEGFGCFNDCFTRKLKAGMRPFNMEPDVLASPCDGLLSVYPIDDAGEVIPVKQSRYTISDLLRDEELAQKYRGGHCLVFRLCVNHYHRYAYLDSGNKSNNVFIPGVLHTVRPIALRNGPVFTENCREYTVMHTDNFGDVIQIEVGAMLVGKIKNHHGAVSFVRGEEKGMFLYGGSTIVVLLQPGAAEISLEFIKATCDGYEYPVVQGQKIGRKWSRTQFVE